MHLLVCCRAVKTLALATAVLVACSVALSACGGPPEDASKKSFCAQQKLVNDEKSWKSAKAEVLRFRDLGTPQGIPEDAREGFVELVGYTEAAGSRAALTRKVEGLGKADRADLNAFDEYVTTTCAG